MSAFIESYWGKAKRDETSGEPYHLLVYHALDVAAVADAWWQQDQALQALFCRASDSKPEVLRAWLCFFIALHDLGKFDARFQWKAPEAARCLWPQSENKVAPVTEFNHGLASEAWFYRECEEYGFAEELEQAGEWIQAVAKHHGSACDDGHSKITHSKFAAPEIIQQDRAARIAWVQALRSLFLQPAGIAEGAEPPAIDCALLAGFCSVADWIGSNPGDAQQPYFTYQAAPIAASELGDYFQQRRALAARALADFGLCRQPLTQGGMATLFAKYSARGVQTLIEELPVEPGLTIIEAPTGSGKTEAALAYASRLLAAGLADSIIFALPTQATSNAMLKRFIDDELGQRLFPGQSAELILAHGKARFNQNFEALKSNAAGRNAQGPHEALNECCTWLAASRKRVFLGQIGICTIDQALLSVLPVRHHFVRSLGLYKSVLIIDEVHAYDAYMYGLLGELLKKQLQVGGSVILLSATLPNTQKQQLLSTWGPVAAADTEETEAPYPYPLISHAGAQPRSLSCTIPHEKTVQFSLHPHPDMLAEESLLREVVQAAQAGAKVAIICNLVDAAQQIYQQLQTLLGDSAAIALDLFHARYRFADRNEIEQQALNNYGNNAAPGGRILVATQVVEQSLDLDFDWMLTQLCPVDLVFQRLGRLHRHQRPRPSGFESPRCTLFVPSGELEYGLHAKLYGVRQDERQMVENRLILWRTQQLISQQPQAEFPKVYRDWIECAYCSESWVECAAEDLGPLPKEPDELIAESLKLQLAQDGKFWAAKSFTTKNTNLSDDGDQAHFLTRDGEMSLQILPFYQQDGVNYWLDGEPLINSEDLDWAEQLSLNAVPAPASWKSWLKTSKQNGESELRYWLLMQRNAQGAWQAELDDKTFTYHQKLGLRKAVDS